MTRSSQLFQCQVQFNILQSEMKQAAEKHAILSSQIFHIRFEQYNVIVHEHMSSPYLYALHSFRFLSPSSF